MVLSSQSLQDNRNPQFIPFISDLVPHLTDIGKKNKYIPNVAMCFIDFQI